MATPNYLIEENHFELNATDKIEDISVGGRRG